MIYFVAAATILFFHLKFKRSLYCLATDCSIIELDLFILSNLNYYVHYSEKPGQYYFPIALMDLFLIQFIDLNVINSTVLIHLLIFLLQ